MWRTDMSYLESQEAARRGKAIVCSSMVGVLVGLIVATFIESEKRVSPPASSTPAKHADPSSAQP